MATKGEMKREGFTQDDEPQSLTGAGFVIVGGAEKAGTTSLYGWLAAHPEVCPSLSKETDYFRGSSVDLDGYLARFPALTSRQHVRLESSPGYLAEADTSASAIARVVPGARMVFVLRDPIDRLQSCYRFYQSRLHLPPGMSLDAYADLCLLYVSDPELARKAGVADWHLNALARGRYEQALLAFHRGLPASQILLIDYRELAIDVKRTVQRVARFSGIDAGFFDDFAFARENVSFAARNQSLQRAAIYVNDGLETVWRRFPLVKRRLLALYKSMNATPPAPASFSASTMARLQAYYAPTHAFLGERFGASDGVRAMTS
jgi:hypothetical protein